MRSPRHLALDEAEDWLRQEIAPVASAPDVRFAALSRLASASRRRSQEWGWLLELEFEDAQAARETVADEPCAILLGDLRLLGMSPTVVLVEGVQELRT